MKFRRAILNNAEYTTPDKGNTYTGVGFCQTEFTARGNVTVNRTLQSPLDANSRVCAESPLTRKHRRDQATGYTRMT